MALIEQELKDRIHAIAKALAPLEAEAFIDQTGYVKTDDDKQLADDLSHANTKIIPADKRKAYDAMSNRDKAAMQDKYMTEALAGAYEAELEKHYLDYVERETAEGRKDVALKLIGLEEARAQDAASDDTARERMVTGMGHFVNSLSGDDDKDDTPDTSSPSASALRVKLRKVVEPPILVPADPVAITQRVQDQAQLIADTEVEIRMKARIAALSRWQEEAASHDGQSAGITRESIIQGELKDESHRPSEREAYRLNSGEDHERMGKKLFAQAIERLGEQESRKLFTDKIAELKKPDAQALAEFKGTAAEKFETDYFAAVQKSINRPVRDGALMRAYETAITMLSEEGSVIKPRPEGEEYGHTKPGPEGPREISDGHSGQLPLDNSLPKLAAKLGFKKR